MKMSYKIALLVAAGVFALAIIMMSRPSDETPDATADATPPAEQTPPRKSLISEPGQDGSVASLTQQNTATKTQAEPTRGNLAKDVRDRINAAANDPQTKPEADADKPATSTDIAATESPNPGAIPLTRTDTPGTAAATETKPTTTPTSTVSSQDLDAILGNASTPKPTPTLTIGGSNTTVPPTTAPSNSTAALGDTYTVQAGETFSAIAKKLYNDETRWFDIAQANPLVDPTRLRVGQVLRLPDMQASNDNGETIPPGPEGIQTYTIRPGDSLSTVAEKFYDDPTLWRTIYNFNRDKIGDNPNAIQAGMALKVPPRINGAQ